MLTSRGEVGEKVPLKILSSVPELMREHTVSTVWIGGGDSTCLYIYVFVFVCVCVIVVIMYVFTRAAVSHRFSILHVFLPPSLHTVETVCSLISSGTELKIFKGTFSPTSPLDVNIPVEHGM